jgi:hypothetical protein
MEAPHEVVAAFADLLADVGFYMKNVHIKWIRHLPWNKALTRRLQVGRCLI